jgi:2-octaprenyl-6-methoxyphenol hydroxylase
MDRLAACGARPSIALEWPDRRDCLPLHLPPIAEVQGRRFMSQATTPVSTTAQSSVLIAGGGLVGLTSALALAWRGCAVSVLEARAVGPAADVAAADTRHLALAHGTIMALQALGVWPQVQSLAGPLKEIHVSRRGGFGQTLLRAAEHGFERFGAVVPASELLGALERRVQAEPLIELLRPARVVSSEPAGERRTVVLDDGSRRDVALLVVAEGSESPLRDSLGIPVQRHDYERSLISCAVRASRAPTGRAYERLDEDGPMALLPRADGRFGLVWTVTSEHAERLSNATDAQFLEAFQARFGERLGRFGNCGRRSAWPLRMAWAERLISERAVLVGNAAQSLHPIGAQGFNLGLRDAMCLAAHVGTAADPGAADRLARHAQARQVDRDQTRQWTSSLLAMRPGPLDPIAALGFAAMDLSPALQRPLVERAMGLAVLPWL